MRVLIVKTSSMGDVLHTLPALTDAMQAIPGIRFDWVVEEGFTQIPGWHPAVDRVIPVAIRRWRKNWFGSETRQQRCDFKREVQSRTYDAVIDAQGLIKSAALITRVAKGEKHGQDCKSAREPFASWFYNQRHEIDKNSMLSNALVSFSQKVWAIKSRRLRATTPSPHASFHIHRKMLASIWSSFTPLLALINTGLKSTGAN